jgi:ABC-type glycerol-3-phosphate transport system substrate-binding protein
VTILKRGWLVAVGLILVLGAFGLSACGKKSGGATIKISSWGDLQENQILVDLIAEFEKNNPKVKVELQRVPFQEYVTKLLTQITAGTAPDVIFVETNNFVDLYLRDAFEPLNPYIQGDSFSLTDYYPQVLDRFSANNNLYAIPRDTAPICVVYYNKKAFDEAKIPYPSDDWDWNQFLAAGMKLVKKDATGKVTRWGFIEDWVMWEPWLYSAGGRWADDVKKPTKWLLAQDPGFVSAIQFRADLMHKYKVMPSPSSLTAMGGMGTSDMFMNGTVAMFLSGIWKTPRFREITDFKWDIAMFPKGPTGVRAFGTGGSGYGILKSSKYKKESWDLIKYISGPEGAKRLAATGLAQPAIMSIAAGGGFIDGKDPLNKRMLLDAVRYVKYQPMAKNTSEVFYGIVGPELDKVWNGGQTGAQAAEALKPKLASKPPITQ